MKFLILTVLSLGLWALCGAPAVAAPIGGMVVSTFDSDLQGWTSAAATLSYSSEIGNAPGSALFDDKSGGVATIQAPGEFLGDWSLVRTIQFQHRIIDFGAGDYTVRDVFNIKISGPGGVATFQSDPGTVQPSHDQWVDVVAPVEEGSWILGSGTWNSILSDVTDLRIQIEMVDNFNDYGQPDDQDAIDNVVLNAVPEPMSVLLVSSAVIGILGLRRKVMC